MTRMPMARVILNRDQTATSSVPGQEPVPSAKRPIHNYRLLQCCSVTSHSSIDGDESPFRRCVADHRAAPIDNREARS
jgi:hypothetical protein